MVVEKVDGDFEVPSTFNFAPSSVPVRRPDHLYNPARPAGRRNTDPPAGSTGPFVFDRGRALKNV